MKDKIIQIVRNIASASGDSLADVADIYEENYFKKEIDELSTLIQESNRESVRDAYRKGYFDSGVQPTSSEVIKFEKSYMEYLKSLDKKGKL